MYIDRQLKYSISERAKMIGRIALWKPIEFCISAFMQKKIFDLVTVP